MSHYLPIGTVVQLNNGEVKLMIINRFPLFNHEGTIGYFDYSACVYPLGNMDNQAYFFNSEDIHKIWFEGYVDEQEKVLQARFELEQSKIGYPRLQLDHK